MPLLQSQLALSCCELPKSFQKTHMRTFASLLPPTPRLLQQADSWQSDCPATQHLNDSDSKLMTKLIPAFHPSPALTPQDTAACLTLKAFTDMSPSNHQSTCLANILPSASQLAVHSLSRHQTAAAASWSEPGLSKMPATLSAGQQPAQKRHQTRQQMLHDTGVGHLAVPQAKTPVADGPFMSFLGHQNRTQQKLPIKTEAAKSSEAYSQTATAGAPESGNIYVFAAAPCSSITDNHSSTMTQLKLHTESQACGNAAVAVHSSSDDSRASPAGVTNLDEIAHAPAVLAACHKSMLHTWQQQHKSDELPMSYGSSLTGHQNLAFYRQAETYIPPALPQDCLSGHHCCHIDTQRHSTRQAELGLPAQVQRRAILLVSGDQGGKRTPIQRHHQPSAVGHPADVLVQRSVVANQPQHHQCNSIHEPLSTAQQWSCSRTTLQMRRQQQGLRAAEAPQV